MFWFWKKIETYLCVTQWINVAMEFIQRKYFIHKKAAWAQSCFKQFRWFHKMMFLVEVVWLWDDFSKRRTSNLPMPCFSEITIVSRSYYVSKVLKNNCNIFGGWLRYPLQKQRANCIMRKGYVAWVSLRFWCGYLHQPKKYYNDSSSFLF